MKIELDELLDFVTKNVYDAGHGLMPTRYWVVDAERLLDHLREQTHESPKDFGRRYDDARLRVHGPDKGEVK